MSVAVVIPSISASQPRSFWSTFIRDAAIVACIVGTLRLCLVLLTLHGAYRRGDFSIYYTTATAMREGHNPYLNLDGMARRLGFTPLPFDHAADSPAFILSMEPLTYFAPPTAYLIWVSASAAALVFAALLLFGAPAGVRWRPALVMFLFALGFTPVADNFTWAQTQIFVLLGLVIVMRLAQHGFDRAAGALLAILGLLRIFPLVIGGYLLVRKKWSAITSLAVTFAAGAAFVVALAGPPVVRDFFQLCLPATLSYARIPPNVSMDEFVWRTFNHLPQAVAAPNLMSAALIAIKLAVVALSGWLTIGLDDRDGRAFALWTAAMLVLLPLVWVHYMLLLLIPLALMAVAGLNGQLGSSIRQAAVLSYVFVWLVPPLMSLLMIHRNPFNPRWTVLLSELGFLSVASAYGVACLFATEKSSGVRRPAQ